MISSTTPFTHSLTLLSLRYRSTTKWYGQHCACRSVDIQWSYTRYMHSQAPTAPLELVKPNPFVRNDVETLARKSTYAVFDQLANSPKKTIK